MTGLSTKSLTDKLLSSLFINSIKMTKRAFTLLLMVLSAFVLQAQQVIQLYPGKAPGSENWDWQEQKLDKPYPFVYNVVNPTLTAYLPDSGKATGTAVVVCPGGAFHILSMEGEGTKVAEWLQSKGVAAFILRYRLVRSTTGNPIIEMAQKLSDFKKLDEENAPVVEMAIADGQRAIEYIRQHAEVYHINPKRIGIMGFSAGGTVTLGVGLRYTRENRPDFLAPIYAYTKALREIKVPSDAPPIFICAATDDQLGMALLSTGLYDAWVSAGHSAELHMYSKGGHGFGMSDRKLPVSGWKDRFSEWMELQKFLKPSTK